MLFKTENMATLMHEVAQLKLFNISEDIPGEIAAEIGHLVWFKMKILGK